MNAGSIGEEDIDLEEAPVLRKFGKSKDGNWRPQTVTHVGFCEVRGKLLLTRPIPT